MEMTKRAESSRGDEYIPRSWTRDRQECLPHQEQGGSRSWERIKSKSKRGKQGDWRVTIFLEEREIMAAEESGAGEGVEVVVTGGMVEKGELSKATKGSRYEQLCRYVMGLKYKVGAEQFRTGRLAGGSREGGRVRHQIDLYWRSGDGVCEFLVFANAKYRKTNIGLPEITTLLAVMQEIGAQKGMLITNTGFSRGVRKLAKDRGIALVIIRPLVDLMALPVGTVEEVGAELEKRAAEKGTEV